MSNQYFPAGGGGSGSSLSGAEIKTAYEAQPDTNAFTDNSFVTVSRIYPTLAALLASTDTHPEGAVLVAQLERMTYKVAPTGAQDAHEVTAGFLRLYETGQRITDQTRAVIVDTGNLDFIHVEGIIYRRDVTFNSLAAIKTDGGSVSWTPFITEDGGLLDGLPINSYGPTPSEPTLDFIEALLNMPGVDGDYYAIVPGLNVWQDRAATIPAIAAGDAVSAIDPLTSGGNQLRTLSANAGATLQQDGNGCWYVHAPETASFVTQQGIFTNLKTVNPDTYIAAAIRRDVQESKVHIGFGSGGGNYIGLKGLQNQFRLEASAASTGFQSNGISTRLGSVKVGVPAVIDFATTANGLQSSFQSGGDISLADSPNAGGLRFKETDWQGVTISDARWGINTHGGQTNAETYFYGLLVITGKQVDTVFRKRVAVRLMQEARLTDFLSGSADLIGGIGQSNWQGVGDQSSSVTPIWGTALEYNDTGFIGPLIDPTQHARPGDHSLSGSAIPAMAKQWFTRTGGRLLSVNYAASGEAIITPGPKGGWGPGSRLLREFRDKIVSARAAAAASGIQTRFRMVVYMGGENDASAATLMTDQEYANALLDLAARVRDTFNDTDLPFGLISIDRRRNDQNNDIGYARIRAAMVLASQQDSRVHLIMPYQDYLAQGLHNSSPDDVHLSQPALNDIGTRAANGIADALGFA